MASKTEADNTIIVSADPAEAADSLAVLKTIDEEVQYAIAKHQSDLSATSNASLSLYLILLVAFFSATSSGFDGSLMGS